MLRDPADVVQEREADYRILNIDGGHESIGAYLGEHTPLRVLPRRSPQEPDPAFAVACLGEVARFHPDLPREYRAYAEAKGVPLGNVLSHVSLNVTHGQVGQCSTVGCRTPAGDILIGRNYDFRYRQQWRYILQTSPPGYAAHLGTNSGLVGGRYDGVNEHGVFVSLHTVLCDQPDRVRPGVPFHLVVRIALETSVTARQAMETIRRMPLFHSFNYFVADADRMFAIEAHPEGCQVMGGAQDRLAVTNHYRHPDLQSRHGRRPLQNSRARLLRLMQASGPADESMVAEALADHSVPVCGHHDGSATLWSAICRPGQRRIAYALGAPCRNPYRPLPWPGQCRRAEG